MPSEHSIEKLARIKSAANPPREISADAWERLLREEAPRLGEEFLRVKSEYMAGMMEADAEARAFGHIALLAARRFNEALKV